MTATLRDSDRLRTPEYILHRVRQMGVIALDPCSGPGSTVDAMFTLSLEEGDDGLTADWLYYAAHCAGGDGPRTVWMNPPYGRGHLRPWTEKAIAEAARGCEIISLLPHDITTKWWARMRDTCSARVDVDHRIAFVGGAHGSGVIRNALFYHGPRPYLFAHHLGGLGEVHLYRR